MGGHGALTLALRHPGRWRSVSAFAPICAPSQCPWGQKAFSGYLGADSAAWAEHDACELLRAAARCPGSCWSTRARPTSSWPSSSSPSSWPRPAAATGQELTLRRHPGYDHSYWFIQTFIPTTSRITLGRSKRVSAP